MTTTAWAHLPNAKHIDWVLASAQHNPQAWDAAWDAALDAAWDAALDAARGAALDAARDAARDAAWDAALDAGWAAARAAAWSAGWAAARAAAWSACGALIAWDDSADMLDMPVDAVRLLKGVGNHAAVLLLPACIVRHQELLTLKEST